MSAAKTGVPGSTALPLKLPTSALLSAIRDEGVRDLLKEEEELRRRRVSLRDELRVVQDGKERVIRDLRPKTDKFNNDLNSAMAELHSRKDALYKELDTLRVSQGSLSHVRDELRMHSFTLTNLNREVNDAEVLVRDEQRELDRVERAGDSNKIAAVRERIARLTASLQAKTAERKRVEDERSKSRGEIERLNGAETAEQRNERFKEIRKQINDVQVELAETKKRRAVEQPENSAIHELRGRQSELHEALSGVESRLDTIRRSCLPYKHFTYPPDCKMEIVGRGGTTLRQLQIDFEVAVCVDMVEPGNGFVLGGADDVAACVAAIHEIVSGAADAQVETASVSFDPSIKRQLIGTRGSTIDSFEKESGARLRVKDDEVEITGSADAVDAAKTILEEFLDNLGTGELPVDSSRISQVIGKGGATISAVEKESGVRSLRLDRPRSRIVAAGKQEAIAKAFAMYKEILGEVAGGSATVQATDQLVRSVIGPKGRTVRAIEDETGARINCDSKNSIQITGSPDAVKAAKERIEELRRSETRMAVDARTLNFLAAPIVRVGASETSGAAATSESFVSPLEAVQRATGCDQIVPVRSEGVVVIRGRPEAAQRASMLVKQLILRNPSHTLRVPYVEVVRPHLLRRQTAERGSSLLDQLSKKYSPLLRVDVDRDSRTLHVSSNDAAEAREAAQEVADLVKDIVARQVRILADFPDSRLGQLFGSGGATIRELQDASGTEIAVVRELQQVQVFSATADAAALDRVVIEIRRTVLGESIDAEAAEAAAAEEEA